MIEPHVQAFEPPAPSDARRCAPPADHHAGRQRSQKLFHLRAPQLTPHNNLPHGINAVGQNTFFAKSKPIALTFVMDGPLCWSRSHHQSGADDAVGGRPPHHSGPAKPEPGIHNPEISPHHCPWSWIPGCLAALGPRNDAVGLDRAVEDTVARADTGRRIQCQFRARRLQIAGGADGLLVLHPLTREGEHECAAGVALL